MILKTICNDNDMYETQKKERLRAMKTVQTVTGEAPISQLGHCQMHEHLFVAEGPATRKNPAQDATLESCGRSAGVQALR